LGEGGQHSKDGVLGAQVAENESRSAYCSSSIDIHNMDHGYRGISKSIDKWRSRLAFWSGKHSFLGRKDHTFAHNDSNTNISSKCFLSVVPIIYLTMTSRFPRTRKFANPYALMAVDLLFAILWLSAFATVTNWNAHDLCGAACGASKGVSGVTFIIWYVVVSSPYCHCLASS